MRLDAFRAHNWSDSVLAISFKETQLLIVSQLFAIIFHRHAYKSQFPVAIRQFELVSLPYFPNVGIESGFVRR